MKEHTITVDVHASWSDAPPRYRVYVDSDLLTERDFIWPGHDVYICEHILVNLSAGNHELRIEQVGISGVLRTKNITINGEASASNFVTE